MHLLVCFIDLRFLSKVVGARFWANGGDVGLAHGKAIDPFSVLLSLGNIKTNKVSSAIAGREQLDISSVPVVNPGRLGVLDAEALSLAIEMGQNGGCALVIPEFDLVKCLSKRHHGTESQQDDESFEHFVFFWIKWSII